MTKDKKIETFEKSIKEFKTLVIQNRISKDMLQHLYLTGFLDTFLKDDKCLVFIDYYVNEGSLNTLNKDSKYNYKGKIVPIGNRMQEIRKAQNAGKLDEIDKQFLNSLGMVFYVKAIRVLEIFCEKNNCTLSSLPKNQIIVIDGHKYDIKTILNNLNANHPEGEGLTEQELDVLAKLGIKWKTIKNKDETTLSV